MSDNEYLEVNGKKIKAPDIALGKVIPHSLWRLEKDRQEKEAAEKRAEAAEKMARLYFWGGIFATVFCTIIGYLLGKFC